MTESLISLSTVGFEYLTTEAAGESQVCNHSAPKHEVHIVAWNWHYVELPMVISIFILISGLVKIGKFIVAIISRVKY